MVLYFYWVNRPSQQPPLPPLYSFLGVVSMDNKTLQTQSDTSTDQINQTNDLAIQVNSSTPLITPISLVIRTLTSLILLRLCLLLPSQESLYCVRALSSPP